MQISVNTVGYVYLILGLFFLAGALFPPLIIFFDNFGISQLTELITPDVYLLEIILLIIAMIAYHFPNDRLIKIKFQIVSLLLAMIIAVFASMLISVPAEFLEKHHFLRLMPFFGFFFIIEGICVIKNIEIMGYENGEPKLFKKHLISKPK